MLHDVMRVKQYTACCQSSEASFASVLAHANELSETNIAVLPLLTQPIRICKQLIIDSFLRRGSYKHSWLFIHNTGFG